MAYTLTLYFETEKEKEDFKLNKPKVEVKPEVKLEPKYSKTELNKMLKADLIKLLLK